MICATPIYDLTPFTMLDFPDKTACVLWFAGCNMRCKYCHNPDIVTGQGRKALGDVLAFLEKRRGILDGVVISGGEATTYKQLPAFLKQVRQKGYAIKLDSNGTNPTMIKQLFEDGLIDYLALDYKSTWNKFKNVTGTGRRMWSGFQETLEYLCTNQKGKFEIRTTVHTGLINENDVTEIMGDLDTKKYCGTYYVQNYRHHENGILGNLSEQEKELRPELVSGQHAYTVEFRNF